MEASGKTSKPNSKKVKRIGEEKGSESKIPFSRNIRLLFAAVLLTAALFGVSVYGVLSNYQENLLQNQEKQLSMIAENVSNSLEVLIREYQQEMEALIRTEAFQEAAKRADRGDKEMAEAILWAEQTAKQPLLSGAAYLADGEADAILPETDVTYQKTLTKTGTSARMEVVADGSRAYYLRLTRENPSGGRLVFYLSLSELYQKTAAYIKMGEKGYVMVKDSDGVILMHSLEEQIGQNVIADRQAEHPDYDFSELKELVARQKSGETGVQVYHSYWWAEEEPHRVKKISAFTPALAGDDFLIVSAVIDYEELAVPIHEGAVKMLLVIGGFGALLLLLFFSLMLSLRSRSRMQRENDRLRQLNEQLEELRRREEILAHKQRLELIGTMTGGIAHEFNNLLTPIMGYSALLLADEEDGEGERREELQEIYDSAVKAKEIIDQISRFSGKNSEKTFRNIAVTPVIQNALNLALSGQKRKVKLQCSLAGSEYRIQGNPTQLQQIILNLCTNAFYAMQGREDAALVVESEVLRPEKKKDPFFKGKEKQLFYRLTIQDNGCGMEPEVLEQIFVPFFTTKKAGEGTGLGLAVVHRMVEAHGGHICVESTVGIGTKFVIYLPVWTEKTA